MFYVPFHLFLCKYLCLHTDISTVVYKINLHILRLHYLTSVFYVFLNIFFLFNIFCRKFSSLGKNNFGGIRSFLKNFSSFIETAWQQVNRNWRRIVPQGVLYLPFLRFVTQCFLSCRIVHVSIKFFAIYTMRSTTIGIPFFANFNLSKDKSCIIYYSIVANASEIDHQW